MLLVAQVALGIYGVLLIAGGIMGRIKAGSSVSLAAGVISGGVALGALWTSLDEPQGGLLMGAILALLLTGVFASRFVRTRKFMPAGIVLILSLIVGVLLMMARQKLGM